MIKNTSIKLFESSKIRTAWDEEKEAWFFSVVDTCAVLAQTDRPRKYWADLKKKLQLEGSQLSEKIGQLKLTGADGKLRLTDVADTEQLLRLIQSIPSPKAEPFKQWLAAVGAQRLDETADPELAIERALLTYQRKGYSEKWINQRLKSIEFRKELTDEWERSGVRDTEYALLTNELTQAWSGMTTGAYKAYKGLKKESLRDNMTNTELVLNMLAEVSTTEISKATQPSGFAESKDVARQGGNIARNAKLELEQKTGVKVISRSTAKAVAELDK